MKNTAYHFSVRTHNDHFVTNRNTQTLTTFPDRGVEGKGGAIEYIYVAAMRRRGACESTTLDADDFFFYPPHRTADRDQEHDHPVAGGRDGSVASMEEAPSDYMSLTCVRFSLRTPPMVGWQHL